jgi:hypothetical protein
MLPQVARVDADLSFTLSLSSSMLLLTTTTTELCSLGIALFSFNSLCEDLSLSSRSILS